MADTGFISWHGSGAESRVAFGDNEATDKKRISTVCWICDSEKTDSELGLCPYCEAYVFRKRT